MSLKNSFQFFILFENRFRSFVLISLSLAVLCLAGLWFRCAWEFREHVSLARELARQRAAIEAFAAYRDSLSWSTPWEASFPLVLAEFESLIQQQTDQALQLRGLDELRRGLVSSRSWLAPRDNSDPYIVSLDQRIANIARPRDISSTQLREPDPPTINFKYQILAQLLFWAWIASAFLLIWRGFSSQSKMLARAFWVYAPISLCFYLLWLLSLALA